MDPPTQPPTLEQTVNSHAFSESKLEHQALSCLSKKDVSAHEVEALFSNSAWKSKLPSFFLSEAIPRYKELNHAAIIFLYAKCLQYVFE